ncbi:universal stress protein [Tessaracoccus antarcticus]|uniref:Universal stress protein n=1 Tax=Tessaracoccus antarcticus TaxID=2479848 RepID=A0A3M0G810_9ACTN|nr:universal stress protein [Tessaracoccus antarcticus]RMB61170.1 universal stress protein [Tessaracoccus antarcticus]
MAEAPQPHPSRLTPFAGHPVVVGVVPGQPELVTLTAASWAAALGVDLYVGHVDQTRITVQEFPDGSVRHTGMNVDAEDDSWRRRSAQIASFLDAVLADSGITWHFRYLAGRPDRSLTHLARAVDASALVVGTHAPGASARWHDFVEGSMAARLSHHQHRPVLVVPLRVVDWHASTPWQ